MTATHRMFVILLTMILTGGCSSLGGKPFDPALIGQQYYLCCSIRFSSALAASDANYGRYYSDRNYTEGPILPAGSRVKITKVGRSALEFHPVDSSLNYTIAFGYGREQQSPSEYFAGIFSQTDPMSSLGGGSLVAKEIRAGRLIEGMTKEQVLMARGYPPAHQTPNLKADEWIFYETPGVVDRVRFADGKLASMSRGPAPE